MKSSTLQTTRDVIVAYVMGPNKLNPSQLCSLIDQVGGTFATLGTGQVPQEPPVPAVPVSKSIHKDYLICLEDGCRLKTLRRHLMAKYDLTPEAYRKKWGLPSDYPMTARTYSAERSRLAKHTGLGRNGRRHLRLAS